MNLGPMFDPNQGELDLGIPTRYEERRSLIKGRVRGQRHRELISRLLATSQFGDHILRKLPLIYGVESMERFGNGIEGRYERQQAHPTIYARVRQDHGVMPEDDRDVQATLVHEVAHAHDKELPYKKPPNYEGFATGVEIAHYGLAPNSAYEEENHWSPEEQSDYEAGKSEGLTGERAKPPPYRKPSDHIQLRLF